MPLPPVEQVSAEELRRMFNEGGFAARAQAGQLLTTVVEENLASPQSGEAPGTRSQLVLYEEFDGTEVATVHQYLRKDGDIGASGQPDPKSLFIDGTLYVLGTLDGSS